MVLHRVVLRVVEERLLFELNRQGSVSAVESLNLFAVGVILLTERLYLLIGAV